MKTVSAGKRSPAERGIDLKIVPFGPTVEQMRTLGERVAKHRAVQALLGKTRHRLLRIDLIDMDTEAKPAAPRPPDSFRAIFYDYTNERTVSARGALARLSNLEVTEAAVQPLPSEEEFDEAVRVVTRHADFAAAVRDQRLVPYQPMPPLIGESRPDGRVERTVAVGLMPREGMEGLRSSASICRSATLCALLQASADEPPRCRPRIIRFVASRMRLSQLSAMPPVACG